MNISLLLAAEMSSAVREFAPHGLFILGVLFITAFLVMRIRKRGQRNATQPTAREHLDRYKNKEAVRGNLEGLMVDIEELARRLGAQLDAKSRQIETLLTEADERIAKLGGDVPVSSGRVDRFESSGLGQDGSARSAVLKAKPNAPEQRSDPDSASAAPFLPPTIAVKTAAEPAVAQREASPAPSADPLVGQVHRLADVGKSASDIAAELGEHIGKVELILALRKA
ncbi:MAG: hypothetical protein V3V20_08590 [Algisphaera sp.]